MLAANALFATTDSTSKWLLTAGYAALQLAFMRYASQLLITSVLVLRRGTGDLMKARALWPRLVLRASLLVVSTILNFFALTSLSLSVTSAIMFSAPIIVCALSWPLLGERVGPFRWAAVALGFLGVMVVIRPFEVDWNVAALLTLAAAFGLALYAIMTRAMAQDVEPLAMQFILGLVGTALLLPLAWVYWVPIQTIGHFFLLALLGCWAWFGHELLIRAHKVAEANYLGPYAYSYLIYMTLAGYLLFGDIPDAWTVVGAAMITGAGLLIWWREMRVAQPGNAAR